MDMSELATKYREHGHVVVPGVVDPEIIAELAALVSAAERHIPPNGLLALNPADEPARSIAADPRLEELAGAALDGPPVCFGVTFVVKPAHHGLPALWHQDGYPWREQWGIEAAVTLWLAVDPAGPDQGGLQVIPGSHRLGLHPLRPQTDPPNVFGWSSPRELVDEEQAEWVALEPGDVSIHHPALLHSSAPNRSASRRAVLTLRYRTS